MHHCMNHLLLLDLTGLYLKHIIPFTSVLKVTTFMAFVYDPCRLPFTHNRGGSSCVFFSSSIWIPLYRGSLGHPVPLRVYMRFSFPRHSS